MRAVIQRVSSASVQINGLLAGEIGSGVLLLLGVHRDDTAKDVTWLADKAVNLRIFDDNNGKMNLSLLETGGSMLIVSQFTLLGDCRKGRRPSWSVAAPPDTAKHLYEKFIQEVQKHNVSCATGRFQAMMEVTLVNSGPVTMLLDSHKEF
jgi:D-tyrosyl-tRNA(Tyr) deacylase